MEHLIHIKEWAMNAHAIVNHEYDNMPYSYHLKAAADMGMKFIHHIPFIDRDSVIAALYCHDIIEDTRQSYNDLLIITKDTLSANIVFAVTNDKGKTRAERAGNKYYTGIRFQLYASFVKLCDRIANATYSKLSGSNMFKKYKKENEKFLAEVMTDAQRIEYKDMINHLEGIFNES